MQKPELPQGSIFLPPDAGRHYDMGKMKAVFKADEAETQARYCVSEWWLEPNSDGPGAHLHEENDEVFYVLEGTASLLVGETWMDAQRGAFFSHSRQYDARLCNRTDQRMGLLNFFIPGGFERNMPSIVKWFEENR